MEFVKVNKIIISILKRKTLKAKFRYNDYDYADGILVIRPWRDDELGVYFYNNHPDLRGSIPSHNDLKNINTIIHGVLDLFQKIMIILH